MTEAGVANQHAHVPLDGKFVITPEEVAELVQQYDSVEDFLLDLIPHASKQSRPGISNYHVGAVAIGESGAVYIGANMEFKHAPLFQSVHAEQFVLVNALSHGEHGLKMLAVSAAPCGHCRQFYSELNCAETMKFVFYNKGRLEKYMMEQLLPGRFTPSDLLPDRQLSLLMEPQSHPLAFTAAAEALLAARKSDVTFTQAATVALQEAKQAYTLYTNCPSGAAVVSSSGTVSGGRYIESAAYNPSLPPFQAAVINACINHLPDYTQIKEVILVELNGANVRHEDNIRLVLQQVAPDAKLTVLNVEWCSDLGSSPPSTATVQLACGTDYVQGSPAAATISKETLHLRCESTSV